MYHEHPIRILKYSIKNLWLLIFPLIRGIHAITFDVGKLYHWIKGAWFDIAVLAAIIIFGLIRWYFSFIRVTDSMIIHIAIRKTQFRNIREDVLPSSVRSYEVKF